MTLVDAVPAIFMQQFIFIKFSAMYRSFMVSEYNTILHNTGKTANSWHLLKSYENEHSILLVKVSQVQYTPFLQITLQANTSTILEYSHLV